MDSLEGFSPEDTTGFIAIQGEFLRYLNEHQLTLSSHPPQEVRSPEAKGWRVPLQVKHLSPGRGPPGSMLEQLERRSCGEKPDLVGGTVMYHYTRQKYRSFRTAEAAARLGTRRV